MAENRLAAHLWTARKRAIGHSDAPPLSAVAPRLQRQYARFAEELTALLPDLAEQDAAGDLEVVVAAVDEWEAGRIAPHDALTVIRDQLRGNPIPGTEPEGQTHG